MLGSTGIIQAINQLQQHGIPVTINPLSVHKNTVLMGASATHTIPSGSKGWFFAILTGTGTFDGVAVPTGFSLSDNNINLDTITVTTDGGSSAFLYYNS
jgi:hypothetical protein